MKKLYIYLMAGMMSLTSCSDWLDVDPKTSIPAEKQFESEYGFKDALTGVYLKLTATNMYGRNLTFGYLDELAQLYTVVGATSQDELLQIYRYKENLDTRAQVDGIYMAFYNTIANVNHLLKMLEEKREVLVTEHYYETMKGEALALRAFLHFDLLRLFGPIYADEPSGQAIPYRTEFNSEATPILAANEVVEKILADLQAAQDLLKEHDPLDFFTDREFDNVLGKDMFLLDRQFRMNLFAVKAMMARVYCYKGDVESRKLAAQYAKEVIGATDYFSLYKQQSNENYNSIRYREQIFGISVFELDELLENNNMSMAGPEYVENSLQRRYVLDDEKYTDFYDMSSGGSNDWRTLNVMFGMTPSRYHYSLKYNQSKLQNNAEGMDAMPLIRLPEMYYIAIECAPTAKEAADLLNEFRQSRGWSFDDDVTAEGLDDLDVNSKEDKTKTKRINHLMREVRKEYFAEGQLFFFLKAHHYKTFAGSVFEEMTPVLYQWPLPDNETIFGNNSK